MSTTSMVAITAQPAIPLFTPAPYCFDDIWAEAQPCDRDNSATCTVFLLGRNDGYEVVANECLTATFGTQLLPGTQCPISYTKVDFSTTVSSSTTTGTLTCCPSHQSFTYTATGSNSVGRCAAVSPSLPGSPPWTVTLSQNSLFSSTIASAVFNPTKDSLIAPALYMTYVAQDGITCAPNCQSPYTGDGHSPPTATPSVAGCDTMCELGRGVFVTVVVVPIVVVILIVGLISWCCISSKRRGRVTQKKEQNRQGPGSTVH